MDQAKADFRVRSSYFSFGSLDPMVPPSRFFRSAKSIKLTQRLKCHGESEKWWTNKSLAEPLSTWHCCPDSYAARPFFSLPPHCSHNFALSKLLFGSVICPFEWQSGVALVSMEAKWFAGVPESGKVCGAMFPCFLGSAVIRDGGKGECDKCGFATQTVAVRVTVWENFHCLVDQSIAKKLPA